jgi:hypothetical protein
MAMTGVRGFGGPRMGDVLFYGITWPSAAAALCAGLFFTADCLSEEKREGTLGFLFLTDLRGYDVVLGKLLATSLRGLYALLALFPILAVALLMGGITGAHFWKTCLALLNALVCSLAAGLFISAISRDSQKALAGALLLLILWTAGGPLADFIISLAKSRTFNPFWTLLSPGYSFVTAGAWGRTPYYWWGLINTQVIAWVFFALACFLTPRTWQERASKPIAANGWSYVWKYGGPKRRAKLRRKLLDQRPIVWLACRERWQSLAICAAAIIAAGAFIAILKSRMPFQAWMVWSYFGSLFTLLLYLWTASQACRLFIEARRSGFTELLLATPITETEIVLGHWRGLLRMFILPVLILMAVHVTGSALSQLSMRQIYAQASAASASSTTSTTNQAGAVTVTYSTSSRTNLAASLASLRTRGGWEQWLTTLLAATAAALSTAGNLVALCWFGMWMGMTSRTANLATLKTLLFVQIIPALIIYFGSTMLVMAVMAPFFFKSGRNSGPNMASYMMWWPLLSIGLTSLLAISKDIGFFVWSRKKLYSSFREQSARSLGQPHLAAPPPLPPIAPSIVAAQT